MKYLYDSPQGRLLAARSAGNLFIRILSGILAFVVQLIYARLLGADNFGDFVYAISWMNMWLLVAKFGVDVTAVRFVAEYETNGSWSLLKGFLRYGTWFVIGMSTGSAAVAAIALYLFHSYLNNAVFMALLAACILLPVTAVTQTFGGYLRGFRRVLTSEALDGLLRPAIMIAVLPIAVIVYGVLARGVTAIVIQLIATVSVLIVSVLLISSARPQELRKANARMEPIGWAHVAFATVLASVFNLLLFQLDTIIVGAIFGTREAGIYAMVCNFVRLVIVAALAVNAVLAPHIASYFSEKNIAGITRTVEIGLVINGVTSIVGAVVLVLVGKYLLSIVGPEFAQGYLALCILAVAHIFNSINILLLGLLNMTGGHYYATVALAMAACLNVVLDILLIPRHGIEGAAVAIAISMAVLLGLLTVVVRKRMPMLANLVTVTR